VLAENINLVYGIHTFFLLSMRLDVNISLRPKGSSELKTKVEIKNINSFRFVADAVEFECIRQAAIYEQGLTVSGETRQWDEKQQQTKFMRTKEGFADYRCYLSMISLMSLYINYTIF
jgi:aspartyl-tRNA(Asn)/glutamyl-tRNA(Gln) amidotransferase subunit B